MLKGLISSAMMDDSNQLYNTPIKQDVQPFIVTPASLKSKSLVGSRRRSSSSDKKNQGSEPSSKKDLKGTGRHDFGSRRRTAVVLDSDSDEDIELENSETFGKVDDVIGNSFRRTSDIAAGLSDADDDTIDSDAEFEAYIKMSAEKDGSDDDNIYPYPEFGKSRFSSRSTTTSIATTTCNSSVISSSGLTSPEGSDNQNIPSVGTASPVKPKNQRRHLTSIEVGASAFPGEQEADRQIEGWAPAFAPETDKISATVDDSMLPQSLADWTDIDPDGGDLSTRLRSSTPPVGKASNDASGRMNQSRPNIRMPGWIPPPPLLSSDDGNKINPTVSPTPRPSILSPSTSGTNRRNSLPASQLHRSFSDASPNQNAMLTAFSWQSPKKQTSPKSPMEPALLSPNSANPRMVLLRSSSSHSMSTPTSGKHTRNGSASSALSVHSAKPKSSCSNSSSWPSDRPKFERNASFGTHSSEAGEHWEPRRPKYQQRRSSTTSTGDMAQAAAVVDAIVDGPGTTGNNTKRSNNCGNSTLLPVEALPVQQQQQQCQSSYYDMYRQYYYYQQHYYHTMMMMMQQQQQQFQYQQQAGLASSASVSSAQTTPNMPSNPPSSPQSQYSFQFCPNPNIAEGGENRTFPSNDFLPSGNANTAWASSGWSFPPPSVDGQNNDMQSAASSQYISSQTNPPDTLPSFFDPKSVFETLDEVSTCASTIGSKSKVLGEMSLNDGSGYIKKNEDWTSTALTSPASNRKSCRTHGSKTAGVDIGDSKQRRSSLRRRHSMGSTSLSTKSRSTLESTAEPLFPSPDAANRLDFDKDTLTSFFNKQNQDWFNENDDVDGGEHDETSRQKHRRNNSLGTSTADLEYETQFFEEADELAMVTAWKDTRSSGIISKTPVVRIPSDVDSDDASADGSSDDEDERSQRDNDQEEGLYNDIRQLEDKNSDDIVAPASSLESKILQKKMLVKKKVRRMKNEEAEEGRPVAPTSPHTKLSKPAGAVTSYRSIASSTTLVTGSANRKKKRRSDKAKKTSSSTDDKKKKTNQRASYVDTEETLKSPGNSKRRIFGSSPSKSRRSNSDKRDRNISTVKKGQPNDSNGRDDAARPQSRELTPPPLLPVGKKIGNALKVLRRWKNGKARSKIRGG